MIGKNELAAAVTQADAVSDLMAYMEFWQQYGVDVDGAIYVAEQRAMRMIKLLRVVSRVSPQRRDLQTTLAVMFLDGLAAGVIAKEQE